MLTINTRNDKLAAARVDFSSRGMLQGTCLGEVIRLRRQELGIDITDLDYDDNNDDDELGGPDGNGEDGGDLDLDNEDDDDGDNGAPGPVNGPTVFSEVILAQKRGAEPSATLMKTLTDALT